MFDEMIVNTSQDFRYFASMFVSGILTGVLFDIFRALRRVWKSGIKLTSFEDVLFLTGAFIIFSYGATFSGPLFLRWYVFVGSALGVVLYFLSMSKYFIFAFEKIFLGLSESIKFLSLCLLKFVLNPSKKFFSAVKSLSKKKIAPAICSVKGFRGTKKIVNFSKNIFTRQKK